jgi:disulfide oxidoreductase YuzD
MRGGTKMKLKELDVEIKLDPNMNSDYKASQEILEQGFNSNYPVIIDEDGWILDGNHRYELFVEAGRENEIEFLIIDSNKFNQLIDNEIDNGTIDKFDEDDEYFYNKIKSL